MPPDLDDLREEARELMLEEAKDYTARALDLEHKRRRPRLPHQETGTDGADHGDMPALGSGSDSDSDILPIRAAARCPPKVPIKPSHLDVRAVINQFSLDGADHQMLLPLTVVPPDGARRTLKILIDTGAQANIIRRGALPPDLFRPATKPISMVTASGAALPGGRHTVDITLLFRAYRSDGTRLP